MTAVLAIFDCDGVLVDSEPIAARVMAEVLSGLGYPMRAEDCIERFTGISMGSVIAAIEADWGRPLPDGFVDTVRARDFAAFERDLRPIPGVEDVLAGLRVPRCIASSGAVAKMRFTLSVTGLLGVVEPHLFSAEMVARGKPAPDLFRFAAERMGTDPTGCVVVEDSVAGVTAARAAGMRVAGFVGGGHADDRTAAALADAGADAVFARMADVGDWIARTLDG